MKSLEYKGFIGTINFCDEDNIYYGKVVGLPKIYINYHGNCLDSLKKDFMAAIDFHLLPNAEHVEKNTDSLSQAV